MQSLIPLQSLFTPSFPYYLSSTPFSSIVSPLLLFLTWPIHSCCFSPSCSFPLSTVLPLCVSFFFLIKGKDRKGNGLKEKVQWREKEESRSVFCAPFHHPSVYTYSPLHLVPSLHLFPFPPLLLCCLPVHVTSLSVCGLSRFVLFGVPSRGGMF